MAANENPSVRLGWVNYLLCLSRPGTTMARICCFPAVDSHLAAVGSPILDRPIDRTPEGNPTFNLLLQTPDPAASLVTEPTSAKSSTRAARPYPLSDSCSYPKPS
ncbi:hypothetical protein MA16_Dca020660 [Dendrobium catenatum]|uniref:Uncharacterized protein n=1 Tax=Dendrobium catenatum TaxID=906689 RepID=A0A2I0XG98_9ASPA|nr:hypothetical protein MA16_Dca020660 [Dendrobium catenatum]